MEQDAVLSGEELHALGNEIAATAATIDAATHSLLSGIRRFDEHGGWFSEGAVSCAQWLSWRIGLAPGAARERVRVAQVLGGLPLIDDALRLGQLSYSKVRALTRVADSENEQDLLDIAVHSTGAQLEKICRLYRQVGARTLVDEDRRWVSQRQTDDGMISITARLFPEEAAVVMQALRVSAGTGNDADGLVAMSEAVVRGDSPSRAPTEVMMRIDASTLTGEVDSSGVPAEISRRLLCDAGIVPVLEDKAGNTLNVGRKSRTVPAAIKRALHLRDATCQFPGCDHTRWLDAHHVRHWCHGGETSADNLVLLCPRHHCYVHEYGFSIRAIRSGEFEFVDPNGNAIADVHIPPSVAECPLDHLGAELRRDRVVTTQATNFPSWDGLPLDYDAIIDALFCSGVNKRWPNRSKVAERRFRSRQRERGATWPG